jgi:cation-transporting ATPase E
MGSGTDATKAIAQVILLDNRFATLPHVVAEGRRVVANIERVATLFLTKTTYATMLAFAVGVVALPFPFLPRHLSLVSEVTIGIPAFVLSFRPSAERARPGFVGRVLRFAVPAGLIASAVVLATYAFSRSDLSDATLDQARTAATIAVTAVGMRVLFLVAVPLTGPVLVLNLAMIALFAASFAIPVASTFYALDVPPPDELWVTALIVTVGLAVLEACRPWMFARPVDGRVRTNGPSPPTHPSRRCGP